jgi:anti-anti-sigma factor
MAGQMPRIVLEPLVGDEYFVVLSQEGDDVRLRVSGSVDMEAVPSLSPFLQRLHAEMLRERLRLVVFDLQGLEFMSSSPVQCLVTFLHLISQLAAEQRYAVRFLYNPRLQWQRRSLEALLRFAPDVVTLQPAVLSLIP